MTTSSNISCLSLLAVTSSIVGAGAAGFPASYQGTPFDEQAYRAAEAAEADVPRQPFRAFEPVRVVWDSTRPTGTGWVGSEEPGATIGLGKPDGEGRRFIHYHVALSNYRYAAFGWRWVGTGEAPIAVKDFDAVSFSLRVSGARKPQELFFGLRVGQPGALSLREFDPEYSDGSWHRITVPLRALKGLDAEGFTATAEGLVFETFVWDPSDFDVELDHVTWERALSPAYANTPRGSVSKPLASVVPQRIPGKIEAAFYDLGGEGVAYHDTTPINILSGVLNQQRGHQRGHATRYHWNFRRDEGVDISFAKDWADLNHPNLVDPPVNQLYIGGTEDGEWSNYTVNVAKAGTYRILAAYGNDANGQSFTFSLNNEPASVCRVPLVTGSMHKWNKAEVGTITFPASGKQLLTLYYGRGFNLGFFEFEEIP